MTITLELTPEQEERLNRRAQALGKDSKSYLMSVIDELPESESPQTDDLDSWPADAARHTLIASADVLTRVWGSKEEDDAWRDL